MASSIIAQYRHPLLGEMHPVEYLGNGAGGELRFRIVGEATEFGLPRLLSMDSQDLLQWEDHGTRDYLLELGATQKTSGAVAAVAPAEIPGIAEDEESVSLPLTRHDLLLAAIALLMLLVVAATSWWLWMPH
jgi:hypothetical protein